MKKATVIASFVLLLVGSTTYVLLDTFVLEQKYGTVAAASTNSNGTSQSQITLKTYRQDNTTIYVADIYLAEGETIQSALAQNTYGKILPTPLQIWLSRLARRSRLMAIIMARVLVAM